MEDVAYQVVISIHAPARGATVRRPYLCKWNSISIHAPARGATKRLFFFIQIAQHFNPRSREGSDGSLDDSVQKGDEISIHAPARGATPIYEKSLICFVISIHAPARGATDIVHCRMLRTPRKFQSTLPRGERLQKHTNN